MRSWDTPDHWLRRAAEARALAEEIQNPEAKARMFAVATSYEAIALRYGEIAGAFPGTDRRH